MCKSLLQIALSSFRIDTFTLGRYDAYVVVGYGPKAIAMNDQTRTHFKGLQNDDDNEEDGNDREMQKPTKAQARESKTDSKKPKKYEIAARWTIESNYLKVSGFVQGID